VKITSCILTNLEPYSTYEIRVQAEAVSSPDGTSGIYSGFPSRYSETLTQNTSLEGIMFRAVKGLSIKTSAVRGSEWDFVQCGHFSDMETSEHFGVKTSDFLKFIVLPRGQVLRKSRVSADIFEIVYRYPTNLLCSLVQLL